MDRENSILPQKNKNSRLLNVLITFECLAVIALIALFCVFYFPKYVSSYEITSQETFFWAVRNSSEIGVKKEYRLGNDITVNVQAMKDNIQDAEYDFYGTLDGQGNTITIVSSSETQISAPIFNTIKEGATVKGLNIVLSDNVTITGDERSDIALLTKTNYGTIEQCCVSVGKMVIGNCNSASVIARNNRGTISKVGVNVDKISSDVDDASNWNSRFGAIAVANYADVNNVVVNINFDPLVVFDDSINNEDVGYVLGLIGVNASLKKIYVANTDKWDYACDTDYSGYIRCYDLKTPCKEIVSVDGRSIFKYENGKVVLA